MKIDLRGRDFSGADLRGASCRVVDLRGAHLRGTNFSGVHFSGSDLRGADLRKADLRKADLRGVDLSNTDLRGADLREANLVTANLTQADLTNADLSETLLIRTNLQDAKLNNCRIYGIAAWDLNLAGAKQSDLIITPHGEPTITVDNLKVAQFIYLLLNNAEIRDVMDTIARKVVLILGRFTPKRKEVLNALRDALRECGYAPIMFDFQKPNSKSYKETVSILARLSRFVIADITSAKVILQELEIVVPHLTSVPIQPILQTRARQTVVIRSDYKPYPWFLETVQYQSDAIDHLSEKIISPAEAWIKEHS